MKIERTNWKCEAGHHVYRYTPDGSIAHLLLCPTCDRDVLDKEIREERERRVNKENRDA